MGHYYEEKKMFPCSRLLKQKLETEKKDLAFPLAQWTNIFVHSFNQEQRSL